MGRTSGVHHTYSHAVGVSLAGVVAAVYWEPLLTALGAAGACPVLVRKGAAKGTASALLNSMGARFALPTYTRADLAA